jgi:hypothetical protein
MPSIVMPSSPNDFTFWRDRASKARAAAAQMTDASSHDAMLAVATRYERLANLIVTDVKVSPELHALLKVSETAVSL